MVNYPKLCGTFNISFPKIFLMISGLCSHTFLILVTSELKGVKGFLVSISGVYQMQKSFFGIVSHSLSGRSIDHSKNQ